MDAVVLVGGEGTRMRPLTYDTPKQMLPIVDRPLIEHVAGWLGDHCVERLILSLGYRPDAFLAAYPESHLAGVELVFAVEPELLDTAGAVRYAARAAGVSGRFVVVNGDVLTDFDLTSLVRFHEARGGEASIFLTPVPDPSAFGVVETDPVGRVLQFVEKPAPGTAPSNYINAGTYVLEPTVLDRIECGRRVSIERETFPSLVSDGTLYALASEDYWLDTGTPEKYIQAQLDILDGLRHPRSRPRECGATEIAEGIFVAPSCTVEGALLRPAYLGARSVVAGDAELVGAVVGDRVEVAEGAVLRSCVVMSGASVGKGAVIEHSIVGPGAIIEPEARVAGLSVVRGGADVPAGLALEGARYGGPDH